jgi:RNA polymerase sigma-70 factor (ECF subfamily)
METESFKAELIALLPKLRGHAMALTGSSAAADDLVQETVMRAWRFREGFQDGSNMAAWVGRILRNTFYTVAVAQKRTVQDVDGRYAAQLVSKPEQEWRVKYGRFQAALLTLPAEAREALVLVVGEGHSYEEAAAIAGCPVGTMKSRVNRARERLAELIDIDLPKSSARAARRAANPASARSAARDGWAPTASAA